MLVFSLPAQDFNNIVNLNISAHDMVYVGSKDRIYYSKEQDINGSIEFEVCTINSAKAIVETCIPLQYRPYKLALSVNEAFLFVSHSDGFVSKINLQSDELIATYDLGSDDQFGKRRIEDIFASPVNPDHYIALLKYSIDNQAGLALYDGDTEIAVDYVSGESLPEYFIDEIGPDNRVYISDPYSGYSKLYSAAVTETEINLTRYSNITPGGGATIIGNVLIDDFGELYDLSMSPPQYINEFIDIQFFYNIVPVAPGVNKEKILILESRMGDDAYGFELEYAFSVVDLQTFEKTSETAIDLEVLNTYYSMITLGSNQKLALFGSHIVTLISACEANTELDLFIESNSGCKGQSLTVTAPDGYENYVWSNGMTGQQIEISEETQLSVAVIDEDGCKSNDSNTIYIEFLESPRIPWFDESSSQTEFCKNDTLFLSARGNNFDPVFQNYLWSTGDTSTILAVTNSGEYSLQSIGVNGCISNSIQSINVIFNNDTIPNRPSYTVERDTTLPCESSSVTLIGPDNYDIYQWSNGETSQEIEVIYNDFYSLIVGNSYSCLSERSEALYIESTDVGIEQPIIQVSVDVLASSSTVGNQWFLNGDPIIGATGQYYTPEVSGFYSLQLTIDGCSSSMSELVNFIFTSISDTKQNDLIKVYPNPVEDNLLIEGLELENFTVKLYSSLGQELLVERVFIDSNKVEFSLKKLLNGIYTLVVFNKKGEVSSVKRVVKQ